MRCTTDDVAGYSETPQLKKLGILPGVRLDVRDADAGWSFDVEPDAIASPSGPVDVVLAFVRTAQDLERATARRATASGPPERCGSRGRARRPVT